MSDRIIFIGLGAMGLPMARNLVQGGHEVVGVESSPQRREEAVQAGIPTLAELAEAPPADLVVVMVANTEQLAAVLGAIPHCLSGATWVVMGTMGRDAVRAAADQIMASGGVLVDAPVTGGRVGAIAGTLLVFVSGPDDAVGRVWSALELMGRPRLVGSRPGDGQAMKIVNQLLCSVHLAVAGEALALAEKMGIDPAVALELLTQGAGGSWMLADRGPKMLAEPSVPSSTIDIFVKDATLVAEAGRCAGAATPILDAAREQFLAAAASGLGAVDDSQIIQQYRNQL